MHVLFSVLFSVLVSFTASAEPSAKRVYRFETIPQIEEDPQVIREIMQQAFAIVKMTMPSDMDIESVKAMSIPRPDFRVELVQDNSPLLKEPRDLHPIHERFSSYYLLDPQIRSYTMIEEVHPRGPFTVRIHWDRIRFQVDPWDEGLRYRPPYDVIAAMAAAIVREMIGSVRTYTQEIDWLDKLRSYERPKGDGLIAAEEIRLEKIISTATAASLRKAIYALVDDDQKEYREALQWELAREEAQGLSWHLADQAIRKSGVIRSCEQIFRPL